MVGKNLYSRISVEELEKIVKRHNYLYFVERRPEISDYEFDVLVEELKMRKPNSKVLDEIGSDLTKESTKVTHEVLMLSLDKAYDEKTMGNWASKFSGDIVASPKIDGCAVSIKYGKDGILAMAATRGNGRVGELITKNVLRIKDIPKQISLENVEIRGEIYMALSVFKKYAPEFANPRNLAAGAIKQKDPKKTAEYNLSFWGYDILGAGAKTEVEKRKLLAKNNIPIIEWKLINKNDIQKIFESYLERRGEFDFETDGVVYKVNYVREQDELDVTAHHPRFAIAYKFQGDSGETKIVDVLWSVARTGVITPVAVVEPVELSGATVTHASLHNYGMFKKMGLTKGATVLMLRRGGVIPNLEKVVKIGKGEFKAPERCPSCGSLAELRDDFLYCTNKKSCMKTRTAELEHFIKTIECDGFGDKLIAKLYENQLVIDPSDFYTLTKSDLLGLERMGDVLALKLIGKIDAKKHLSLDIFLRSLGIRELGRHVAVILAEKYKTIDNVLAVKKEELAEIHTIGDVIAKYVVEGLKEKRSLIEKLLEHVTITGPGRKSKSGVLAGKKFLFTGSMISLERKDGQRLVEENGGLIASSMSKEVDYLVIGDGGGAGSKLVKAEKLIKEGANVKIVGEKEFLKMVGR